MGAAEVAGVSTQKCPASVDNLEWIRVLSDVDQSLDHSIPKGSLTELCESCGGEAVFDG